MAAVNLAPLLEHRQDLGLLPGQQPVDRVAAAGEVLETVRHLRVLPPPAR